jgi:hypothetical protein
MYTTHQLPWHSFKAVDAGAVAAPCSQGIAAPAVEAETRHPDQVVVTASAVTLKELVPKESPLVLDTCTIPYFIQNATNLLSDLNKSQT